MKIDQGNFSKPLLELLKETFEVHQGAYLDKNTSLFTTLESISAEQASMPVGGNCATLAAQLEHIIYYLEVLEKVVTAQDVGILDWDEIWQRVNTVSTQEWADQQARLKVVYKRIQAFFENIEDWEAHDEAIGGAMAIVVHSAYHLGEIRQALCILE
ncbi:MAG: hypothetical protein JEZ06_05825 [Anaerolineaceae bacterium]|nr:hypothetical protein [Anaerolineaceae bacterium]